MRKFFRAFALTLCAALIMSFASCSSGSSDSEEKTGTSDVTTESPAESPENADVTTESPETSGETPTVATYTVTFDSDGGSEVASQTVESGKTATKPADPTKSGEKTSYAFLGWYNGDSAFDFASAIKSDVTLKAKWLEGFVKVTGTTITGNETWTPVSGVFVSGRSLTIADLYVCDHEVTQAEYEKYCKYGSSSPSITYGVGDNYPAYYVSWYDTIVYCNLRSMDEGLTPAYAISGETDPTKWSGIVGNATDKYCGPSSSNSTWNSMTFDNTADGYRLPTEAEWEYIAREAASSSTNYSGSGKIGDVAWYMDNSDLKTHEVKGKAANALGIYDMSGNVCEWCWDWYVHSISSSTDAAGAASGSNRVSRVGSWSLSAFSCTVSFRSGDYPDLRHDSLGFRVVRSSSN